MDKKIADLEDEIKKIDVHSIHLDNIEEYLKLIMECMSEESFEQDLEQLLASFDGESLDISELQSKLILLLKKYLSSKTKSKSYKIDERMIDEKSIKLGIDEISEHLLEANKRVKDLTKGISQSSGRYHGISKQSRQDFNRAVKYFATYEIYKAINPKRIAGETKKDNFIHNAIVRGVEKAKHYTGGSKSDITHYSPVLLEKLERNHHHFKNKGFER
jgi:hypothetical protein